MNPEFIRAYKLIFGNTIIPKPIFYHNTEQNMIIFSWDIIKLVVHEEGIILTEDSDHDLLEYDFERLSEIVSYIIELLLQPDVVADPM